MTQDTKAFRRLLPVTLATVAMLTATTAFAQPPDVQALVRGMKQALEPVVGPEAFSAFLNSNFTYSDLGFTALR